MIIKPDLIETALGNEVSIPQDELVCQMHAKVTCCFILLEGELEYFITDDVSHEKTILFHTDKLETIIGWEALHSPGRFIASVVVKSGQARFIQISRDDYLAGLTITSLKKICLQTHHFLEVSFLKQTSLLSKKVKQRAIKLDTYFISNDSKLDERIQLLKSSPFFGEFPEPEIQELAEMMVRREYGVSELIYDQDEDTHGIFVLIQGEVSIRRWQNESYIDLRSISTPGYLFGWSSTFGATDICRAYTEQKTSVYFISKENIETLTCGSSFGISFFNMILWLMSNQLQLSHSRYLHLLEAYNLVSVRHLIDINRPGIPLSSPLHQIPHLLKDHTTQAVAFDTLHHLNHQGTKQERHLSSICLDLLKSEEREMSFLSAVGEVYTSVVEGKFREEEENRKVCAEKTKKVFEHVLVHLEGMENLPDEPGHIFIYNHLLNHPYYVLSNRFQLTLDSHFLSSFILNDRYGDPGIRIIRHGKSFEYGHEDYYDNLGYITVYTNDSDLQGPQSKKQAKERFYEEAEAYLSAQKNIIISPEGTSFASESSPGPFKMGPFNLAMRTKKEPFIVPVVFYNFDKRITEKLLFCQVLKPFKVSEQIQEDQGLKDFVNRYQNAFAKEVRRARIKAESLLQEYNNE